MGMLVLMLFGAEMGHSLLFLIDFSVSLKGLT